MTLNEADLSAKLCKSWLIIISQETEVGFNDKSKWGIASGIECSLAGCRLDGWPREIDSLHACYGLSLNFVIIRFWCMNVEETAFNVLPKGYPPIWDRRST